LRNDLDALQTKVNRVSSRGPVAAGSDPLPSPSEAMQAEVNELASKIGTATAKILLLEGERDRFRQDIDTLRATERAVVTPPAPPMPVPNPSQGALDELVAKFDAMAIRVAGLGSDPQTTVPPSSADTAPSQAAQDELTATVERLEAQVTNLQADRDRNGFEAADRFNLDLAGTTNASHQLLINALNQKVDELKATGEKAAEDLRMEGILRRSEVITREAAVKDLSAQVAGLRTELAQLKLDQEADSGSLGPLNEWAEQFKAFFRTWELNQIHDANFLWEQVRLLKDDVHPGWRQLASYDEPHRFRCPAGPQQEALH
jgi:outer membrane murein-binding lipoprotein Lpp